jgi:hypothetical protein
MLRMCCLPAARRRNPRRSECLLLDEKGLAAVLRLTTSLGGVWRFKSRICLEDRCVVLLQIDQAEIPYPIRHIL